MSKIVKCLSIRNPWAAFVVLGKKTIEIRKKDYRIDYRGRLYIHAGKKRSEAVQGKHSLEIIDPMCYRVGSWYGGLLGSVDLIDIKDYPTPESFEADTRLHWNDPSWWEPGLIGLVFERPRCFKLHPCKGQLGYFEIDLETLVPMEKR